ncbi:MAG: acyltransferase, partial [Muribaculaceae bacterium]|nr:acyltransferase [Muribaculaceae bacterium]
DSNDITQESLVKMLSLAGDGSIKENIMAVNLMPVSISYEFDPNDYLKAREFLLRRRDPEFKKSKRDDLFSMETGLLRHKGRIHFRIGKCINNDLQAYEGGEDRAHVVHETCRLIDRAIHCGYHIFPCNYIAYDEVNSTSQFAGMYQADDVERFDNYINGQLDKVDIADVSAEEREFMRHMMLTMYANPLKNQLAALDCDK